MLFATSSIANLLENIGAIDRIVYDSVSGWLYLTIGILLAFWIGNMLISLFKNGVGRSDIDSERESENLVYDPKKDPNITEKSETDIIREHMLR